LTARRFNIILNNRVRGLLQKLGWRTYHFVHSNGLAADVVYRIAFHLQRLLRDIRYRSISRSAITPEELWSHRQFGLAGGLMSLF
jgi:hypothetical protein